MPLGRRRQTPNPCQILPLPLSKPPEHHLHSISVIKKPLYPQANCTSIDGVLYRGGQGIPGAREMLRSIRSKNMRYVFLTNGGGAHEDAKVASLSKRLGLSIDEDVIRDRVILSHTPMRGWADEVKKQTVLITGSHPETARKIANESVNPATENCLSCFGRLTL